MTQVNVALLIAFLFLCNSNDKYFQSLNEPAVSYVDRTFEPYIERFEEEGGVKVPKDMSVVFQDFDYDEVIGLCQVEPDGYRRVTILSRWWDAADETRREVLIFHELAHCVLDAEHDITVDDDGVPASLMYPMIKDSLISSYKKNRKKYLDKLFGR
jgi:hypothetical protein